MEEKNQNHNIKGMVVQQLILPSPSPSLIQENQA